MDRPVEGRSMSRRIPKDCKMRIISERTGELLAEIVVPSVGEPQVRGQYAGTLKVVSEPDGASIDGYLEDREGRVLAWRDGVPDYAAAGLITVEASRADGANPKRIALIPTKELP